MVRAQLEFSLLFDAEGRQTIRLALSAGRLHLWLDVPPELFRHWASVAVSGVGRIELPLRLNLSPIRAARSGFTEADIGAERWEGE